MSTTIEKRLTHIEELLSAQAMRPMTTAQASEYLNLSISTLYKLTSSSSITHYKSRGGKMVSFLKSDLDAWLLAHRVASTSEIEAELRRLSA